jgi:hypothetical protein
MALIVQVDEDSTRRRGSTQCKSFLQDSLHSPLFNNNNNVLFIRRRRQPFSFRRRPFNLYIRINNYVY